MHIKSENISIDDAVLVKHCQRGDADAMGRLIVKYQDRIFNSILKICGNSDDAAELTQETFVKVLESIGSFRAESSFYTWLFRVGINLTLNFCSRKLRLGMKSLDGLQNLDQDSTLAAALPDAKQDTPQIIVEKKETIGRVLAAIEKLNDNQRIVIVLRDIEGMNYEEIAEVLQLETGTVKSRLSRAREALRELLQVVEET